MSSSFVTGSFTTSVATAAIPGGETMELSLLGFGSATVDLQRSYDDGSNWGTIESYTSNTQRTIESTSDKYLYRLDCTHSSGTILFALGK